MLVSRANEGINNMKTGQSHFFVGLGGAWVWSLAAIIGIAAISLEKGDLISPRVCQAVLLVTLVNLCLDVL